MNPRRLNYHHLLYFWTVARTGSVTAAAEELGLAQPTVSAQLRRLEQAVGARLFDQVGRNLELTEAGRTAYRYANDIFSLGSEMLQTLDGRPTGARQRLRVGVADALPKTVAARVLSPLASGADPVHLLCYEGKPGELLGRLSMHELDVVLSDGPVGSDVSVRAFNHQLGECGVSIFAPRGIAARYRKDFPASLDGAPFILPTSNTSLRGMLDYWLSRREIRPSTVAEFEDSALMKAFCQYHNALFAAPAVVRREIVDRYDVEEIGTVEGARERFFAISLERKVRHPGVLALLDAAHEDLFGA